MREKEIMASRNISEAKALLKKSENNWKSVEAKVKRADLKVRR